MLDPQFLKNNLKYVAESLAKKGFKLDIEYYENLETKRKNLQIATQALQNLRNTKSKEVGISKSQGKNCDELLHELGELSHKLQQHEQVLTQLLLEINEFLLSLPNIPDESVPYGKSEQDNTIERVIGNIPYFSFAPKSHDELGESLGFLDFERASKISGARFVVVHGQLAKLQRALIQFMLDTHIAQHGYHEVYVPYIVNKDALIGTGQLPKFEEDLFKLNTPDPKYLISTAEIPVTNLARDHIFPAEELPKKFVCHSPCFRSEAGSYGRDTKGLIRQHQFEKVELVWLVKPNDSKDALENLTSHAEKILKLLELPYRVVTLCSGDMSAAAAKTYDLEVWLPSQQTYREISSCSMFNDYQARRMMARVRNDANQIEYLHTLNGSGLAVGRTLVAIMENYQTEQGEIIIPKVLQSYMNGLKKITKIS